MLEYEGKYGKAKVMIDNIDSMTVSQIFEFLNHEVFTNPISIMPDCHAGAGAVIGFTMRMTDKIIPNVVGVDINCGMLSINIGKNILSQMTRNDIDSAIRARIPFGTNVRKDFEIKPHFYDFVTEIYRHFVMKFNKEYGTTHSLMTFDDEWFQNKCEEIEMDYKRAVCSVGTLGGGNHFIELGKSVETGDYWFTVHSGSRQFGLKVAKYWQKKAGKGALSYLVEDDMFGYLSDVIFAQAYAQLNRITMINDILSLIRGKEWKTFPVKESISTNHNFIDFDDFIIRKGAIRSYIGEKMIIPFNMEDGIIICEGKSNPEWNFSAPHGAGRVGSRSWAKKNLSLENAKHSMGKKGIYCSKLPLDEAKAAYKDPKIIEDAISPTATIIDRLTPVLAMKE